MKKNATKKRLFEVTARLDKTFKPVLNEEVLPVEDKDNLPEQQNLQELQPIAATSTATQQYGQQPDVTYADSTYKNIAPALKQINTPEKFAGAFKGWFQYLGYSPQAGNMTIQRARMDVEASLKQLGYK